MMNNQGIIAFVDSSFIVREMLDLVLSIEKNWQTLTDWKNTKLSGSGAYYTQKLFEYMCDTYNIYLGYEINMHNKGKLKP